jgi:hypothetical protein
MNPTQFWCLFFSIQTAVWGAGGSRVSTATMFLAAFLAMYVLREQLRPHAPTPQSSSDTGASR